MQILTLYLSVRNEMETNWKHIVHAHKSIRSQGVVMFCVYQFKDLNISQQHVRWPHLQNIIEVYNDMHNFIVIHENGIPRSWNYKLFFQFIAVYYISTVVCFKDRSHSISNVCELIRLS